MVCLAVQRNTKNKSVLLLLLHRRGQERVEFANHQQVLPWRNKIFSDNFFRSPIASSPPSLLTAVLEDTELFEDNVVVIKDVFTLFTYLLGLQSIWLAAPELYLILWLHLKLNPFHESANIMSSSFASAAPSIVYRLLGAKFADFYLRRFFLRPLKLNIRTLNFPKLGGHEAKNMSEFTTVYFNGSQATCIANKTLRDFRFHLVRKSQIDASPTSYIVFTS